MKQELMMKQRNNTIEAQVDKTMKLLDEMKPLEVNHFFRARLMQRIERECTAESADAATGFRIRFDFRLAFMVFLILVNLGAAALFIPLNNRPATSGISEMLDKLSDDYTSHEFAYYDQSATYPIDTVTTENQTP